MRAEKATEKRGVNLLSYHDAEKTVQSRCLSDGGTNQRLPGSVITRVLPSDYQVGVYMRLHDPGCDGLRVPPQSPPTRNNWSRASGWRAESEGVNGGGSEGCKERLVGVERREEGTTREEESGRGVRNVKWQAGGGGGGGANDGGEGTVGDGAGDSIQWVFIFKKGPGRIR